ncbi:endonuclease VII domain-containing protein [Micromonospora sp. C31]|uniref:endonuclease VII domain-containing protein n=1 Tax=Micromonospora sp. C31 TaxID=2824876 RepID=UPI001B380C5D|nr:endonuclease VII domain-containing protein [Micromonospora sp. C31]MBQ1076811.1 endonuclease VII domain-containing protein [Micromonospora sp. C31]
METSPAVKICMTCTKAKDASCFYRDRHQPDGRDRRCKDCTRKYRKPYDALRTVASKYGVSLAQYEEALEKQAGVCAICRQPPVRGVLVVDHCHESGLFRGLVCGAHNTGIGLLGDSLATLLRAGAYLESSAREN